MRAFLRRQRDEHGALAWMIASLAGFLFGFAGALWCEHHRGLAVFVFLVGVVLAPVHSAEWQRARR